jgi:hypothetical protein
MLSARDMWRSVMPENFQKVISLLATYRKGNQSVLPDERESHMRVEICFLKISEEPFVEIVNACRDL